MTGPPSGRRFVLIHADESCLGNQKTGPQPGGAGALIEVRNAQGTVDRWDWFDASTATTNNRMALAGAISVLERLFVKSPSLNVHFFSDSRYLVDGITAWVPNWKARGWRRKGGAVENLDLWKRLDGVVQDREVSFHWVRGHDGHPKNEYVDHLAVTAATTQETSNGLVPSRLTGWLDQHADRFTRRNPDQDFLDLEARYGQ